MTDEQYRAAVAELDARYFAEIEAAQQARDDGKIANSEYMDRRHDITQAWIADSNRLLEKRRTAE
jgi:hypothetical protein